MKTTIFIVTVLILIISFAIVSSPEHAAELEVFVKYTVYAIAGTLCIRFAWPLVVDVYKTLSLDHREEVLKDDRS